jgi:hypothetical protein
MGTSETRITTDEQPTASSDHFTLTNKQQKNKHTIIQALISAIYKRNKQGIEIKMSKF